MNIWRLIQKRIDEGWELQAGKHVAGLKGYWASFVPNDPPDSERCSECEEFPSIDWERSGHAMALKMAIRVADRIAQGEDIEAPYPLEFV